MKVEVSSVCGGMTRLLTERERERGDRERKRERTTRGFNGGSGVFPSWLFRQKGKHIHAFAPAI